MRVSIVIPLYNKAPHVRRSLDSIAAQTFDDFEVLVVDDGSTDGGGQVVSDYLDSRFRLITQPNAGPGAARNRGITEAGGELLAFLDADDEWLPKYLEESVRLLDACGTDVATITSGYFEHPSAISREPRWRGRGLTAGRHCLDMDTTPMMAVLMLAYMSPCSTVARADVVRKWGGFYADEQCLYAEDAFLWLKILLNESVAFNLNPLVRFHVEASGLSKNLRAARPVEPFLKYPERIEGVCPEHLRKLLSGILSIRAFKTACVLGYWGHWRQAKVLRQRFNASSDWRLPYYLPALLCSTPIAGGLGKAWRILDALRR